MSPSILLTCEPTSTPQTPSAHARAAPSCARHSREPPDQQPPLFSLRYLDRGRYGLAACQQREKAAFADTLDRLSQRPWDELRLTPRHGLGYEQIPRHAFRVPMLSHLTEDVQRLIAFRFAGNAPMVGYRVQTIFDILGLGRDFTFYDHG